MDGKDLRRLIVDMATAVWRLQDKLHGEADPEQLLRSLSRHVGSMVDALADAGVRVQSHTGDPFDAGQSVHVVAYVLSGNVDREMVSETVMPTVYMDGRVLQMGQIIVATPELAATTESEPAQQPSDEGES